MNILVTGGAGFIGSNFIHYWVEKYPDDLVVNYDKLTYAGNLDTLKDIADSEKYIFVQGDILDRELVTKTLKENNIEQIVHFAAETHVDRSIEGPAVFVETNVSGTQVLLDVARELGNIKFHHVSTDEVFGSLQLESDEKFTESTPYDPRSPYSASKAGSDHLVRAYHETYDLPVTISNCSNNYGPFEHVEKLIPLVISRAMNDEEIPIYGDGLYVRDWIHVDDHCRGIDLIIKNGNSGDTYLLGGDGEKPNLYIVKKILDLLKKPYDLMVNVKDRKGHDRRYAIDYSKTEEELGYTPSKSVDERLEETVNWYVENEWWWMPHKEEANKIAEKYLANRIE